MPAAAAAHADTGHRLSADGATSADTREEQCQQFMQPPCSMDCSASMDYTFTTGEWASASRLPKETKMVAPDSCCCCEGPSTTPGQRTPRHVPQQSPDVRLVVLCVLAGVGDSGSAGGPSLARLNGFASPAARGLLPSPGGMSAATAAALQMPPGCSPGGLRLAGLDFGCGTDSLAGLWDDLRSDGGGSGNLMALADIFSDTTAAL